MLSTENELEAGANGVKYRGDMNEDAKLITCLLLFHFRHSPNLRANIRTRAILARVRADR